MARLSALLLAFALGTIAGFGLDSYRLALRAVAGRLQPG